MNLKGCFSHNSDHWTTPKDLYNFLMNKGYIDPCPLYSQKNNLDRIYEKGSKIYINPPYSDIDSWTEFIKRNIDCNILLLIPARTDTKYFHKLLKLNPFIYFIKGRLKFGNSEQSAPFPSVILHFNKFIHSCYEGVSIEQFKEVLDEH